MLILGATAMTGFNENYVQMISKELVPRTQNAVLGAEIPCFAQLIQTIYVLMILIVLIIQARLAADTSTVQTDIHAETNLEGPLLTRP